MYSVREFGFQCILYSLDEVLRYGDVLNIIQADETDRIMERKEVLMGDKPGDKLGDKSSHTGDRALPFLTETQVGVLAALRDNPNLTKPQLVTMLHRSKTTIDNAIRALREHGLIIRIGSNKTGY